MSGKTEIFDPQSAVKALEEAVSALQTALAAEIAARNALEAVFIRHKADFDAYRTDIQTTLGAIVRDVQGKSGLKERQTAIEAQIYAALTQLADLAAFDAQQKRGPSPLDLANELADLKLTLNRLQTADKYSLTREKLGRLMLAHNLVSADELAQSEEVVPE